jgi:methionine aminopeptidase
VFHTYVSCDVLTMQASDSNKRWMRAWCRRGRVDGAFVPGDVVPVSCRCYRAGYIGDVVRVFHAGDLSKRLICSVCG